MNQIKRLTTLSQTSGTSSSFHTAYRHSAIIHISGLPYQVTEGDLLILCAQYGEIEHIHLPRDDNGKSKGHAFVGYEIQKATDLAVDNFNGIQIGGRTLKVDHVEKYRFPRKKGEDGERTIQLPEPIKGLDLSRNNEEPEEEELDPYLRAAEAANKKKAKRKAREPPKEANADEDPMAEYLAKKKRKEEKRLKKSQRT